MATDIESARALLDVVAAAVERGESPIAQICMLKNHAVRCVETVSSEAVQILGARMPRQSNTRTHTLTHAHTHNTRAGGSGYMRGCVSERVYREVKVLAIGGGATEVMKGAQQLPTPCMRYHNDVCALWRRPCGEANADVAARHILDGCTLRQCIDPNPTRAQTPTRTSRHLRETCLG
jgi:hypothetical protein